MRLPTDHPHRYTLNNEIHARAPQEIEAPEQISYLALTYAIGENDLALQFPAGRERGSHCSACSGADDRSVNAWQILSGVKE